MSSFILSPIVLVTSSEVVSLPAPLAAFFSPSLVFCHSRVLLFDHFAVILLVIYPQCVPFLLLCFLMCSLRAWAGAAQAACVILNESDLKALLCFKNVRLALARDKKEHKLYSTAGDMILRIVYLKTAVPTMHLDFKTRGDPEPLCL